MSGKNQRVVITGSTGFIGSNLIEALLRDGFSNILTLDRNPKARLGVESIRCDIFTDKNILERNIRSGDTVIHLACNSLPVSTSEEMGKNHNELATLLLQICADRGIQKLIFPSSGGTVYGEGGDEDHKESSFLSPQNPHATAKVAMEKLLGSYEKDWGMPVSILRVSNPYGRSNLKSERLGAVDVFLRRAIEREPIVIWGDGENVRDYIHIEDLVEFLLLSIKNDSVRGTYNVGTGIGTSLNEIVRLINKVLGSTIEPEYRDARGVDVRKNILNIGKAKAAGWQPKYSLQEGIENLYKKIKNYEEI